MYVVVSLFIVASIVCSVCVYTLFCYAVLDIISSFAIILMRKREMDALLIVSFRCIVTVGVLSLFLAMLWVCLQCVIVVFPDHTHLLHERHIHIISVP